MAQITVVDIVAPGAFGLNTERASTLLRPEWATVAINSVVNRAGRMASRKGWEDQTSNAISGTHTIDVLFEYLDKAGASVVISTANNEIYKDIDDYTDSGNNITSSTSPSADNWQFINFNGKCLGFQKGEAPIERTSGDFADVSYTGTGPDGNCAVAAFGRVWAADADLQTLRYSVLLDDTDYSGANGGGTIDMSSVWTQGMDEIVAIAAIGSNLVVFGKNHIVMWGDKSGSEIGIDPTELEVVDTLEGTGCIARDSVVATGEGDLIFLSRHGIQSLGRVIQTKNNPTVSLSKNFRSSMLAAMALEKATDADFEKVRAMHSPEEGLYIINFPVPNKQFVLDTRHPFQDDDGDQVFPATEWFLGGGIAGMVVLNNGSMLFGSAGVVGKYMGTSDNTVAFDFAMWTGWLDFSGTTLTRSVTYTGGSVSLFNVALFDDGTSNSSLVGKFAGGAVIQRKTIAAYGEGQFLRLGVTAAINGFDLVVQHMSVAPKIGRVVT